MISRRKTSSSKELSNHMQNIFNFGVIEPGKVLHSNLQKILMNEFMIIWSKDRIKSENTNGYRSA